MSSVPPEEQGIPSSMNCHHAPANPALEEALARTLRWSFWACSSIGLPAVVATAAMQALHVEARFAFVPETVVFFGGLAVFAMIHRRGSVRQVGCFITAWLGGIAVASQINFGPQMGVAVTWMAAAVVAQMYAGGVPALVSVGVMTCTMLVHGWLCSTGRVGFFGSSFVVPGFEVWVRMAIGLAAGMIGVAAAMRAFLWALSEAIARAEKQRREKEEADTRRRALEMDVEAQQHYDVLGRVAAGVAHDVNNALTVVLGTAHLLNAPIESEERLSCLADLQRAAIAAAGTTRQLLSFVPRAACRPRLVNPSEIVAHVARTVKRLLPDNIAVDFSSSAQRLVLTDVGDLQQALLNLVLNARDAMPAGGQVHLRVEDAAFEDGRSAVAISVSDTGAGIPPEVAARLFEPLFTTKAVGKGTGLGLTSIRQFAEESGGLVRVDSAPGRGSAFSLVLPEGRSSASEAIPGAAAEGGKGEHILLVESREEVLNVCRRLLKRGGYQVEAAADGYRAEELMGGAGVFDLLCLDASVSGIPAPVLIRRFREGNPHRPVVVCAGEIADPALASVIDSGEVCTLAKPYAPAELLAAVGKLLGARTRASVIKRPDRRATGRTDDTSMSS